MSDDEIEKRFDLFLAASLTGLLAKYGYHDADKVVEYAKKYATKAMQTGWNP